MWAKLACFFAGCKTHRFDPMTGQNVWYNYCPRCRTQLDR